MVKRKSVSLLF